MYVGTLAKGISNKCSPTRAVMRILAIDPGYDRLGVAEARGAILAAAGTAPVPVVEYSPQQIKSAVTGHGGADKGAVARMIPKLLSLPGKKRLDDELDAIAIGITALSSASKPEIGIHTWRKMHLHE